jgi:hypothetical protein
MKKKTVKRQRTSDLKGLAIPDRVVIEITADGFSTKVFTTNVGCGTGRFLSCRGMEMTKSGAKGTRPGDVYDDLKEFPSLCDELQMTNTFSIAKRLRDIAGK